MNTDFLIIGGGAIGLSVAKALTEKHPKASVTLVEKEGDVAKHASGRNSGVIHAGFYYSADSLKAKFCRLGNIAMHAYCDEHKIRVNRCQKLVVARNESEIEGVKELKRRGDVNGVPVEIIDEKQTAEIEPNAKTTGYALLSPSTSTVNPVDVCSHLRKTLEARGVKLLLNHPYRTRTSGNRVRVGDEEIDACIIINCAGLYASDIAQDFGFAKDYAIMPFKGVYLKYTGTDQPLKPLIYSVPDMRKPFLGVQFSTSVDGVVRIGPTAIPAFWRENYSGFGNFNAREMLGILRWQAELFITNAFGFREFALEEIRKYSKAYLLKHAFEMVRNIDASKFTEWSRPGIRAQLLNTKTRLLEQDFVVEGDAKSIHVLNAVSPAFTSSMPFGKWVVDEFVI